MNTTGSTQVKRAVQPADNFLEALRDLSNDPVKEMKVQVKAAGNDILQSVGLGGLTTSGDLGPNKTLSMSELATAEKKGEDRGRVQAMQRLEQDRAMYMRIDQESKKQIQSILEEVRNLAKTAGEFAKEVQVATSMAPANPGIYHKNFFERLRSFVIVIRQKVQESRHWLAMTNSRAKKQKGYWGKFKQGGTKFMMSQERYAVTSTG